MTHEDFMRAALLLAQAAADEGEVPVGAVIVRDGEVVSTGRNRREKGKNALCHAEIQHGRKGHIQCAGFDRKPHRVDLLDH